MDFEERNFGLAFTRVTLLKKSCAHVGVFGDDSIAQNYAKKHLRSNYIMNSSNFIMNYNKKCYAL